MIQQQVIPAPPYTPNIQGYTWGVFLAAFVVLILQGKGKAWAKMQAYIRSKVEGDGSTVSGQADARMVWVFMLYIYAHAYVRLMFLALVATLLIIVFRLILSIIPLKSSAMRATMDALNDMVDARHLLEFLHFRHWKAHCIALGIYFVTAFIQCYIIFGSKRIDIKNVEETSRQYSRVATLSLCGLAFFYLLYAGLVMFLSAHQCAPQATT